MTVIKIKNSNVSGRLPASGDIEIAELALNIADKKLYSKDAAGSIFEIGVSGDLPSGPNPPNSGNNVGDLFFDTTEGNLVYWDGSAWIPLPGDVDGEGFVKVSGDNMTGDLTLGDGTTNAEKITLDAGTGGGTFKGRVEIDGAANGDLYVSDGSNSNDGVLIQAVTTTLYGDTIIQPQGIYTKDSATIGSIAGMYVGGIKGVTDSSIKISLESSGESTFLGDMIVHGDAQLNNNGVKIQSGLITACGTGAQNSVFRANTEAGGDVKIDLSAGGRASFAGDLYVGTTWAGLAPSTTPPITLAATGAGTFAGGVRAINGTASANQTAFVQVAGSNDEGLQISDGTDANISLSWDGSITAGQTSLTTTGRQPDESTLVLNNTNVDGYNIYSQSNGTGTFSVTADGAVFLGDVASPSITLKASDGSATFAGGVTAVSLSASNTDYNPVFRGKERDANKYTSWQSANGVLHLGNNIEQNLAGDQPLSGDIKIILDGTDGSALFAGTIISGGDPVDGGSRGSSINKFGTLRAANTSGAILEGYTVGSTTSTSRILADGSAEFSLNGIFAGGVRAGAIGAPSPTTGTVGTNIGETGTISATAAGANNVFVGREVGSTAITSSIGSTGTATFSGSIQSGGIPYNGDRGVATSAFGTVYVCSTASGELWQGYTESNTSPTSSIFGNGNATFTGTVTATVVPPSDARFKENITSAKPQLADVVALGGLLKNYDWNDQAPLNEEIRSQRQLGLIAQEVEKVCPSITKDIHRTKTVEVEPAVTGPKGTVLKEAVTKEEDDSYKGISQDALIMKLIGAVAELSAEVTALKAAKTTKK